MSRIRRIMCATDFSRASRAAFKKAIELGKATGAELIVTHVLAPIVPVPMANGAYITPSTWDEITRGARKAAQKQLDALVRTAKGAGVRATGWLVEGLAADRIVRAARSKHADLIVIGTHGRTGLGRLFLGSVASRVVATARIPVLTVHGR